MLSGTHAVPFVYATICVNAEKLIEKTRQHAENLPFLSYAQWKRFELIDEFEEGVEQLVSSARGL